MSPQLACSAPVKRQIKGLCDGLENVLAAH